MLNSSRFIVSIIIMAYILTGCGGGGGGSPAVTPAASSDDSVEFSAELNAADFFTGKSRATTADYRIVAVPIMGFRSGVKDAFGSYIKEVSLKSNGTFYISLSKKFKLLSGTFPDGSTSVDTDYVLLVVDKSQILKDQVVSFITMSGFQISKDISLGGVNSMETVTKVPIGAVDGNQLYAGLLTKANGNEAKSASSSGGVFKLTSNQLQMIARTDDIAKSVKNDYINPDLETKVFYYWYDTNDPIDFSSLISGHSNPNNFRFDKSVISFWEQEWAPGKIGTFAAIGAKSTTVSLYPPGSSTPATNDGSMVLEGDDTYIESGGDFEVSYTAEDEYRLQCCFKSITSIPASGEWRLTRKVEAGSEEDVGFYDFAVGNPFVDKSSTFTSKINTYVPSIKLVVDGSNNVTQIDVKLWTWNYSTTQYEEVTDYSLLLRDDYEMGVSIRAGGTDYWLDDNSIDKKTYTASDFGTTISLTDLQRIRISLNPGPFAYEFSWIKN